MRDNVSIIFAAIFAVVLLIVFPLFSLLTRQNNIAYNKVLTLTTEFVDSVRTKGYFTEKEYTEYLAELAATQNTYKVDMECHKKLLIKDVNKYTDSNPVWVEDTATYYNSYVENELRNSKIVVFEEDDEFYVKLYNTNITTASLMYNFFLNSNIPRKIINIGYGGKVLNSTGDTFTKTTFNSSYTPFVTFEEVVNANGDSFKQCYDQEAGTYEMQYCIRAINIEDDNNNPIKVNFKLNNFTKIEGRDLSVATFEENRTFFIEALKGKIVLRGDYISSYDVEIENLKLMADRLEGTISISNIVMGYGARKTVAHIVIMSNLGIGPTGAASSEGRTEELTLIRRDISSNIIIDGPYLSKNTDIVITEALKNKEKVYYKVTLRDSSGINKLELFDTKNAKSIAVYKDVMAGSEFNNDSYNVKIEKDTKTSTTSSAEEYWISVVPTDNSNTNITLTLERELQIVVYTNAYVEKNVTSEIKIVSKVVVWRDEILRCVNISKGTDSKYKLALFELSAESEKYVQTYIESTPGADMETLFNELVNKDMIYTSKEGSTEKYKINIASVKKYNSYKFWEVYYYDDITGQPEEKGVYINFENSDRTVKTHKMADWSNIPEGFTGGRINGKIAMTNISSENSYYWIPVNESDVPASEESIKTESMRKYKGFWVATDLTSGYTYTDSEQFFTSLVSPWQLNKIEELGSGAPGAGSVAYTWVGNIHTKYPRRFWTTSDERVFHWSEGKYNYEAHNGTSLKDPMGGNIYFLQVLYIK